MSSSVNKDKVLVLPWNADAFNKLPSRADVIIHSIDNGISEKDMDQYLDFFRAKDIFLMSLVMTFESFQEFLSSRWSKCGAKSDIYIKNPGTKREYMPLVKDLSRENYRFILPLKDDNDRLNIKILNSAGVQIMIDMRDQQMDWSQLDDLITDQVLTITPRPSLDPFAMLFKIYKDKEFDLATVYSMSPLDFINYNIHTGNFDNIDEHKFEETIDRKMIENNPCAFCEGFSICKSFLEQFNKKDYSLCKGFFRNLFDAFETRAIKDEVADGKTN